MADAPNWDDLEPVDIPDEQPEQQAQTPNWDDMEPVDIPDDKARPQLATQADNTIQPSQTAAQGEDPLSKGFKAIGQSVQEGAQNIKEAISPSTPTPGIGNLLGQRIPQAFVGGMQILGAPFSGIAEGTNAAANAISPDINAALGALTPVLKATKLGRAVLGGTNQPLTAGGIASDIAMVAPMAKGLHRVDNIGSGDPAIAAAMKGEQPSAGPATREGPGTPDNQGQAEARQQGIPHNDNAPAPPEPTTNEGFNVPSGGIDIGMEPAAHLEEPVTPSPAPPSQGAIHPMNDMTTAERQPAANENIPGQKPNSENFGRGEVAGQNENALLRRRAQQKAAIAHDAGQVSVPAENARNLGPILSPGEEALLETSRTQRRAAEAARQKAAEGQKGEAFDDEIARMRFPEHELEPAALKPEKPARTKTGKQRLMTGQKAETAFRPNTGERVAPVEPVVPKPKGGRVDPDVYAQVKAQLGKTQRISPSRLQRELGLKYEEVKPVLDRLQQEGVISPKNKNGAHTLLEPQAMKRDLARDVRNPKLAERSAQSLEDQLRASIKAGNKPARGVAQRKGLGDEQMARRIEEAINKRLDEIHGPDDLPETSREPTLEPMKRKSPAARPVSVLQKLSQPVPQLPKGHAGVGAESLTVPERQNISTRLANHAQEQTRLMQKDREHDALTLKADLKQATGRGWFGNKSKDNSLAKMYTDMEEGNKLSPKHQDIHDTMKAQDLRDELRDFNQDEIANDKVRDVGQTDDNYMPRMTTKEWKDFQDRMKWSNADPIAGNMAKFMKLTDTTSFNHTNTMQIRDRNGNVRVITKDPDSEDFTVWHNGQQIKQTNVQELEKGAKVPFNKQQWTVEPTTTDAIEKAGVIDEAGDRVQFVKSPVTLQKAIMEKREIERNRAMLDSIKQDPLYDPIRQLDDGSAKARREIKEKGWIESKIPELKGWHFDPEMAWALNDFHSPGLSGDWGKFGHVLAGINRYLTAAIFWNPVPHLANTGYHWGVARGSDWLNPKGYWRLGKTLPKAIKEVSTQGPIYRQMLKDGVPLMWPAFENRNMARTLSKLGEVSLKQEPEFWNGVAKYSGLKTGKDAVAAWYGAAQRALWQGGDVFAVQRIMEQMDKGMSVDDAIGHMRSHLPDYTIPYKVMGSRWLSQVMQDPRNPISIFNRYHYGMMKSLAKMTHDASMLGFGRGVTPAMSGEAVANIAAVATLGFVVQPMLSAMWQHLTGNEDVEARPRGPLAPLKAAKDVYQGKKSISEGLGSAFTLSPVFRLALDVLTGQDWKHKNIIENASPAGGKVAQGVGHLINTIAPLKDISDYMKKAGGGKSILQELAEKLGDYKELSEHDKLTGPSEWDQKAASKRQKEPENFWEGLISRMFGYTPENAPEIEKHKETPEEKEKRESKMPIDEDTGGRIDKKGNIHLPTGRTRHPDGSETDGHHKWDSSGRRQYAEGGVVTPDWDSMEPVDDPTQDKQQDQEDDTTDAPDSVVTENSLTGMNRDVSDQLGTNANWNKFENEARPSQNVEDDRQRGWSKYIPSIGDITGLHAAGYRRGGVIHPMNRLRRN